MKNNLKKLFIVSMTLFSVTACSMLDNSFKTDSNTANTNANTDVDVSEKTDNQDNKLTLTIQKIR